MAGFFVKAEDAINRYRLTDVFLLVFLFLQPFSYFSSIRDAAFVLVFLFFLIKLKNGHISFYLKDNTVRALCALTGVAVLSAISSPYPLDSFDAIRKNLLYQVVIFLVIINEYDGMERIKPIIYALGAGFAALSAMIVLKNDPYMLMNWHRFSGKRETFLGGYALYATFYIPLMIGYLYSVKDGLKIKLVFIFFLILEFLLVFLNNHRAQLLVVLAAALFITSLARHFKLLAAMSLIFIVALSSIYLARPELFTRYRTLAESSTYTTNLGLSGRIGFWKGAWDMIRDRPVIGYGYGWKKIAWVVRDRGYLDKWDKNTAKYKIYNDLSYGSTNTHNLFLQILFEVGALGLIAFVFFWVTVFLKTLYMSTKGSREGALFLRYAVTGVLFSYLLINLTNGLWEEAAGNLMMTLAAMGTVLYRESLGKEEAA